METDTNQKPAAELHVNISFKFIGKAAERFLAYKKRQNLKNNAEVGRKLALDQLDQVFPENKVSSESKTETSQL